MVLLILCILIGAILIYLLLAPFYFEVNSRDSRCGVRFHRLASARIRLSEASIFLELQVVAWHTTMDLLGGKERKTTKENAPKNKKSIRFPVNKVLAVIQSFKISQCHIVINTGDMALNGILFPWLFWVSRTMKKDIRINFNNESEIVFVVENNFYRVLRAYVFS